MAKPKRRPTEHVHHFVESVDVAVDAHGVTVERVTWPCDVKGCNEFGLCLTTSGKYVSGAYRLRRDDPGKAKARARLRTAMGAPA